MKASFVNPVLMACSSILKILLDEDIRLGELRVLKSHRINGCIAIMIWMKGDFNGRFIFSMTRDTALRISSVMMGRENASLDYLSKSAIAEMASIILGRSGIIYSQRNINVLISHPSIVEGDNINILPLGGKDKGKILKIPLIMKNGDVVDVRIEQQP
jgi:chemotaxis protein CheX